MKEYHREPKNLHSRSLGVGHYYLLLSHRRLPPLLYDRIGSLYVLLYTRICIGLRVLTFLRLVFHLCRGTFQRSPFYLYRVVRGRDHVVGNGLHHLYPLGQYRPGRLEKGRRLSRVCATENPYCCGRDLLGGGKKATARGHRQTTLVDVYWHPQSRKNIYPLHHGADCSFTCKSSTRPEHESVFNPVFTTNDEHTSNYE